MASQMHVNDVGNTLVGTVLDDGEVVDISSATSIEMILKKPDQTTVTKTAVFSTNGTDGQMAYTVVSGDLDQSGNYKIQGKVEIAGSTFYSNISTFKVYCNI
jgi:hypothetical protein